MSKDDLVYLGHIYQCILKIQKYTSGVSMEEFVNNSMMYEAVVRNFEIIGEATTRIKNEFKNKHAEMPWKDMKAMRNFLIHEYEEVDLKLVWDSIQLDLPGLRTKIEKIVN